MNVFIPLIQVGMLSFIGECVYTETTVKDKCYLIDGRHDKHWLYTYL